MTSAWSRRRVVRLAAVGMLAALVPGDGRARPAEPRLVIVRNDSQSDIERVTVGGSRRRSEAPSRFGSVAPVPRGAEQSIMRPGSAERLPRFIVVEWVVAGGRGASHEVDLRPILAQATGARGEALVLRIGPGEVLDVSIGATE